MPAPGPQFKISRRAVRPRCTQPDFAAIDADISSGKISITDVWRAHVEHSPNPYGRSAFIKQYRAWQSTEPADREAEFRASEAYWQGRASPRPNILVLDDGAALCMRGGMLEVYDRGKTIRFDAGPHYKRPQAIIFANRGGTFTIQAARFCVDHNITVIAAGWLGERERRGYSRYGIISG